MTRQGLFGYIVNRVLNSLKAARLTDEHFYQPVGSRWLWNEPQKLLSRTLKFDIKALKNVVASVPGVEGQADDVELEKLADGAFNKVLTAKINEKSFIVKLPDPLIPRRLITASEVATLKYLRAELKLPVPKVLAWKDDNDNPVGCEYIIMEEAQGKPLRDVWPNLGLDQRTDMLDELIAVQDRLIKAGKTFEGLGSLYFVSDAAKFKFSKQIAVPATTTAEFCIGPLAHEHFMDARLVATGVDCGPYDYLTAIARSSLMQVQKHDNAEATAFRSKPFSFPVNPVSDLSTTSVCHMLEMACEVIPLISPRVWDHRQPVLWHSDLHDGNIFVSADGKLTSIIDWQHTSILPLYLTIRKPQFLDVPAQDMLYELPDNYKELPIAEKTPVWERFHKTILQLYYVARLKETQPAAAAVLNDEQLLPILRWASSAFRTTDGHDADALMLRDVLLKIKRNWEGLTEAPGKDLEVSHTCPISFDDAQLKLHYQDANKINALRDIIESSDLRESFAVSGWVPDEWFDEWRSGLDKVIKDIDKSLASDKEREEFKERLSQWNITER